MRIMTGGPSSSPGYVYVRVYQYSIYQQGKWSRPKALMLHMWEWKSSNGGPALRSTTDEINGTSDGGITGIRGFCFQCEAEPSHLQKAAGDSPSSSRLELERQLQR
jgi:hypothetical protein